MTRSPRRSKRRRRLSRKGVDTLRVLSKILLDGYMPLDLLIRLADGIPEGYGLLGLNVFPTCGHVRGGPCPGDPNEDSPHALELGAPQEYGRGGETFQMAVCGEHRWLVLAFRNPAWERELKNARRETPQ